MRKRNKKGAAFSKRKTANASFPCQLQALTGSFLKELKGSGNPREKSFSRDGYLRDQLLSRYTTPSIEGLEGRQLLAINKLLAIEEKNKITNSRLSEFHRNPPTKFVQSVISRATITIAEILGELNYSIFDRGGFSNGASTSRLRSAGEASFKFDGKGDVTLEAYPYASTLLKLSPLWERNFEEEFIRTGRQTLRLVEGNVVFTVPKNNTIERVAAKEPDLNMYLQRAVGSHVRKRLLRYGVDLNDQTLNQQLAREGSVTGQLATLDLSAASDSVTVRLIELLLPREWSDLLFSLRSPRGIIDIAGVKKVHEWEMLSTMGNGFTFEIETLIFYSLVRAVTYVRGLSGKINVYGDDIICPSSAVSGVRRIFRYCGFTLNSDKSYWDTPFRESCGKHYYNGTDVTPFYIREPITDFTRLIHFCNRLREWSAIGDICDPRWFSTWTKAAAKLPSHFRGGSNLESILELASPGEGSFSRLVPIVRKHDMSSHRGAYVSAVKRGVIKDPISVRRETSTSFRVKKVRVTGGVPLFPQETREYHRSS